MFRKIAATARKRKEGGLPEFQVFIFRLAALQQTVPLFLLFRRPGAQELMSFCYQFAALLNAGITVLAGLTILEKQADNSCLKHGLREVTRRVEFGQSLSEALAHEQKVFSSFFAAMVNAGEAGGVLDDTMGRMGLHYKRKNDLEKNIKTATAYPKFVFFIILGVVAFLLAFVLPSFAGTFASMGVEPPFLTRSLITFGVVMGTNWQLILAGGAAAYLVYRILLETKTCSYYADHLRLRIPLSGFLHRKLMVSRFCRTLSTLLGSGVGLLTALELTENVMGNQVFAKRIGEMRSDIIRGESVAATFTAANLFPLFVTGMVNVGEQSGRLEEMLTRIADLYESEINYTVERLGSLLEPALVIFLSLMVGGIVLSVYLPLLGVFELYL